MLIVNLKFSLSNSLQRSKGIVSTINPFKQVLRLRASTTTLDLSGW
jgi:hypothetical protein